MFNPAFHDLLKPQWLGTLTELKTAGGLPISELSRRLGSSYMTAKQHCEDLTKLGYLQRIRIPRSEIGRPEIFYRLAEKADTLFPGIPATFTLGMLDQVKQLFGENAPERLLFQYFQLQQDLWAPQLIKATTLLYKVQLFTKIREKEGLFLRCIHEPEAGMITLREFHHPLRAVFDAYPRAVALEQRAIEAVLGVKLRRAVPSAPENDQSYIDLIVQAAMA